MSTLFGMFPFLNKLFADGGYQGPQFGYALAKILPHLDVEIVKRSDRASGFVVVPKRWIVERTIAWLNRCRRLAKDWENLNRKALAFLRLASIVAGQLPSERLLPSYNIMFSNDDFRSLISFICNRTVVWEAQHCIFAWFLVSITCHL